MALSAYALPFGLRDVKLTPYTSGETLGTAVDLPASQTFTFAESETYEELRGDDVSIASHGAGPAVDWSLEAGGISLEALQVITGGTITQTGTTPNIKKVFVKKGTDARPYFKVEGQVISDSGGDVHCVVFRCKAEGDVGGEFSEGSFFLTSCSGRGYPMTDGNLYEFIHNETAVAAS